jgi:hypothetical protein
MTALPTGWALDPADTYPMTYGAVRAFVYRKIAGGAEPANYVWTYSGAEPIALIVMAYSGRDPVAPFEATDGQALAAGSSNVPTPSISIATAGCDLCCFFMHASGQATNPPAGMTEGQDTQILSVGIASAYQNAVATGSTSKVGVASGGGTDAKFGYIAALKLPSAGGGAGRGIWRRRGLRAR